MCWAARQLKSFIHDPAKGQQRDRNDGTLYDFRKTKNQTLKRASLV
jgi:hypothetical protein